MSERMANDQLALQAEIVAVRPVIADQILDTGGATQWLEQRIASGPQLSAGEALAWLDLARGGQPALTAAHLMRLADATSVSPWKGSTDPTVTVLYSGGTAGGPLPAGVLCAETTGCQVCQCLGASR